MMTEQERRVWLSALLTSQLRALCHVAGLYSISSDWGREKMIDNLCLVEGIEVPNRLGSANQ